MLYILFMMFTELLYVISGLNSTKANCRKGTYFNIIKKECILCPKGQYQNITGQFTCIECPNQKITLFPGSDSECKCIDLEELLNPDYNKCVNSCIGRTDGNYQSCHSCNVYVSCSGNIIVDHRPCPEYLFWDDNCKQCVQFSPTCYYKKIT